MIDVSTRAMKTVGIKNVTQKLEGAMTVTVASTVISVNGSVKIVLLFVIEVGSVLMVAS